MDFGSLLNSVASLIQNDSNESTTGLDLGDIVGALGGIMDGDGLIENLKEAIGNENLSQTVASWVGSGENAPLSKESLFELIGKGKVSEFASKLGIDEESAANSLMESLPNMVDKMTNEDSTVANTILEKVGGVDGALDMIGKFFK